MVIKWLPSQFEKRPIAQAIEKLYDKNQIIADIQHIFGDEAMRMVEINNKIEPGVPRVIHEALMKYYDVRVASNDAIFDQQMRA